MDRLFIDSGSLTSQVYKRLRSYHEAGLVDPGLFATELRKGLEDIGIDPGEEDLESIIPIRLGKAKLPDGCITLEEVWFQQEDNMAQFPVISPLIPVVHTGTPDRRQDYQHNQYNSQLEIPVYPVEYNLRGKQYTRKGRFLHLNDRDGLLRIVYTGSQGITDLPQVPNDPIIQEFLVKKLVYEQIRDWYLNGEVNNLDRILQLAQQEYQTSMDAAIHYEKLPSFKTIVLARQNRPKSFNPRRWSQY